MIGLRKLTMPETVIDALDNGAHLVVSVSGGKDSDAMTYALSHLRKERGWPGDFILIHANVGERMEWSFSLPHCQTLAERVCAELIVEEKTDRDGNPVDLMDGIWKRMEKRPDAPPFPSSAARWCTSDWKRAVISKWIRRNYERDADVVCAMGLRAEESPARAKRLPCDIRKTAVAVTKNRNVWDWNPILHWTLEDVWDAIGYTLDDLVQIQTQFNWKATLHGKDDALNWLDQIGFRAHPAYAMGNDRVSCAMCVLANANDLRNGAKWQPETYQEILKIERASGFTWRKDKSIEGIINE